MDKGLLIEIDLQADPLESCFRSNRMVPSARSFGNTAEEPDTFGIGHSEPSIFMSGWSRITWAVSHTDGSMWKGCELFAEAVPGATATEIAKEFAQLVPVMVTTEIGYLERL